MKKLMIHGGVMDNLDLNFLMKEARESRLITVNIKTSMDDAMAQATSADTKVGSFYVTLTQLITPGAGGRLYSMHHDINMVDHNIGLLQKTLAGLCSVVGTLEQKMHHLSQNGIAQLIKVSSTSAPTGDFKSRLSTLTAELYGLWQLTEVGGFNTVVGYFKSLNDFTLWVRADISSDAPKFEHFIDLKILLAGI